MINFNNLIFLFLSFPYWAFAIEPPLGWQFPKDPDFSYKWIKSDHKKYLLSIGDYNGDNKIDTAAIFESLNGKGFGVFVYFNGIPKIYNIFNTETDTMFNSLRSNTLKYNKIIKLYKLAYGIENIKKGTYITACGKEYFDCEKNEPNEITVKYNAISFFHFDAGGTQYYLFDNKLDKFIGYYMDD